jgi:hypothetical protein
VKPEDANYGSWGKYLYPTDDHDQQTIQSLRDYTDGLVIDGVPVILEHGLKNSGTILVSGILGLELDNKKTGQIDERSISQVTLGNHGSVMYDNIILLDRLPAVNDRVVSTGTLRGSEWDAVFVEVGKVYRVTRTMCDANYVWLAGCGYVTSELLDPNNGDYTVWYSDADLDNLVMLPGTTDWSASGILANPIFNWQQDQNDLVGPVTAFAITTRPTVSYDDGMGNIVTELGLSLSSFQELSVTYVLKTPEGEASRQFFTEELANEGKVRVKNKNAYNNIVASFDYFNLDLGGERVKGGNVYALETALTEMTMSYNAIGNRVWIDIDNDGLQNRDENGQELEPGVPNVTVELYATNAQGVVLSPNAPLKTTTTDANGKYLFDLVPEGSYRIKYIVPSEYVNLGYDFTTSFQILPDGTQDLTADSNVDFNLACTTVGTICGFSSRFEVQDMYIDNTLDAGIFAAIGSLTVTKLVPDGLYQSSDDFKFTLEKVILEHDGSYTPDYTYLRESFYLGDNEQVEFENLDFGWYRLTEYLGSGYVLTGVQNAERIAETPGETATLLIDLTPANPNFLMAKLDVAVLNDWGLRFTDTGEAEIVEDLDPEEDIMPDGVDLTGLLSWSGVAFRPLSGEGAVVATSEATGEAVVSKDGGVQGYQGTRAWALVNLLVALFTLLEGAGLALAPWWEKHQAKQWLQKEEEEEAKN